MRTLYRVLSDEERHRVHEESLDILENTGVRVETPLGREILAGAGANVADANKLVKLPKALVESSLKSICRDFTLSARRPGADLVFTDGMLNGGESVLLPDGSGHWFWIATPVRGEPLRMRIGRQPLACRIRWMK